MTHFIIAYHISLDNIQTNYCDNNLLILDVKQLSKLMKLYYFYTLKALWDGQHKIKMYYEMSRVKKQLSGKRSIGILWEIFQWKFNTSHQQKQGTDWTISNTELYHLKDKVTVYGSDNRAYSRKWGHACNFSEKK